MARSRKPQRLTRAQRWLLRVLAEGGCFFAAFRRSDDYVSDDVLFSEALGLIVHPAGGNPQLRYRVRNKTAAPLYLADPQLVRETHADSGGFRRYEITDAGRLAAEQSRTS